MRAEPACRSRVRFGRTVCTVCRHTPARACNPQTLADRDRAPLAGSTQKADKSNREPKLW